MLTAGCSKKAPSRRPLRLRIRRRWLRRPRPPGQLTRPAADPGSSSRSAAGRPDSAPGYPDARGGAATLNDRLAKMEDALFDFDKSTIRPDATTALKDDVGVIRDILAAYPSQKLLIEGHADERGSEEYNLALGDRRAQSVKDFLTSMGIPDRQLTLISYGKERPVCSDESESCYQRNRRAHVTAAQ